MCDGLSTAVLTGEAVDVRGDGKIENTHPKWVHNDDVPLVLATSQRVLEDVLDLCVHPAGGCGLLIGRADHSPLPTQSAEQPIAIVSHQIPTVDNQSIGTEDQIGLEVIEGDVDQKGPGRHPIEWQVGFGDRGAGDDYRSLFHGRRQIRRRGDRQGG